MAAESLVDEDELCDLCGGSKLEHRGRHHKFIRPGGGESLQPLDKPKPPQRTVLMQPPTDQEIVTRLLSKLRAKGILTDQDLVEVLVGEVPPRPDGVLDR